MIYSALFEGNMTRLLPKITYFPVCLFGYFIFFWTFSNILKRRKRIKVIYSYKLGGYECQGEKKLVPSSGTYLFSMQGNMCRIKTLKGKSPLRKNGDSSCKIYIKWLCLARHGTRSGYMTDNQMQGSRHKAK